MNGEEIKGGAAATTWKWESHYEMELWQYAKQQIDSRSNSQFTESWKMSGY